MPCFSEAAQSIGGVPRAVGLSFDPHSHLFGESAGSESAESVLHSRLNGVHLLLQDLFHFLPPPRIDSGWVPMLGLHPIESLCHDTTVTELSEKYNLKPWVCVLNV